MTTNETCSARYMGIVYQCPCILPAGHEGLHECEHGMHWPDPVEGK